MPKNHKKKKMPFLLWLLPLLVVAGLIGGGIGLINSLYLPFQGKWIRKDCERVDLRSLEITLEEYEQLKTELPGCQIRWNIPIGNQVFDSRAKEITITELNEENFSLFDYFEDLQTIHAEDLECYETLLKLESQLPQCYISWGVRVGDTMVDTTLEMLDFTGTGTTAQELMEKLSRFSGLKTVEYRDFESTTEERQALREAYPEITFLWDVEVSGKTWSVTETRLDYAGDSVDAQALAAAAVEFHGVEEIDLTGSGCTIEELVLIQEAYSNALIKSEISLFGLDFTTETETLDLSGIEMESTEALEQILPLMKKLTWVDMCDCGISNEDMDSLNKRYPDTRFVWKVTFSVYTLRTDATFFCASDLPNNGYVAIKMTDEQLAPLKYCEDLIALDLGHMRYTDLSFLENMPKLQFLILVEAKFTDITPIGTLKDLIYLEIFMNTIDDLSPLLECPNLKHLNIGYTTGFDTDVLKQFTGLERLWFPGNTMSKEEIEELKAALPNTQLHLPAGDPDGSTGAGWREADIYFEMRNIFKMHYMPGGTGMGKDKN